MRSKRTFSIAIAILLWSAAPIGAAAETGAAIELESAQDRFEAALAVVKRDESQADAAALL